MYEEFENQKTYLASRDRVLNKSNFQGVVMICLACLDPPECVAILTFPRGWLKLSTQVKLQA